MTFCDEERGIIGETYVVDELEVSMGKVFGVVDGRKSELLVRSVEGHGMYLGRLVYRDLGTHTDWPHLRIAEEELSHGYVGTVLAKVLHWLAPGTVCKACGCEIDEDDDHATGCLAYDVMTAFAAEGRRADHRVLDDTLLRLSVRLPDEDVKSLRRMLQGLTQQRKEPA